MQCIRIKTEKRQFIINLYNDLQKDPSSINKSMEVLAMLFDISQYLKNKDGKVKTMQSQIGVNILFQGYIVRDWLGNSNTNRYSRLNKIIIKHCVNFYYRSWVLCNELYHTPGKKL